MTHGGFVVWSLDLTENIEKEKSRSLFVKRLPNGNTLSTVSDLGHDYGFVNEVNRHKKVVWRCDSLYKDNNIVFRLKYPIMALRVRDGNTLIADQDYGKVVEVDRNSNIIWEWDYPNYDTSSLLERIYRFDDGNTGVLIFKIQSDTEYKAKQHNVNIFYEYIEVDKEKNETKHIDFDKIPGSPRNAQILPNKHILISYYEIGVVEFDILGNIVWSFQLPDSVTVINGPRHKVPATADNAYKFSNGNVAIYSMLVGIYLVSPDKKVLWRVQYPHLETKLGIKYVKEDGERGEPIPYLLGIVDR
jgi:hypothetical protein